MAKGNNNYQVGYTDLPSYEFDRLAKVIPGNIAEFPLEPGLKLNLINTILAMDSTKVRRTSGVAQVILGEKILGVVGFEMNVSGLGTARDPKKGWNLKLKGGDGKKPLLNSGASLHRISGASNRTTLRVLTPEILEALNFGWTYGCRKGQSLSGLRRSFLKP